MTKSAIAAAVLAATVLGGCRVDLTEIGTPSGAAHVSLQFQTERGVQPSLIATFFPGGTSGGEIRPVDDDALYLDGVSIPPESVGDDGTRFYRVAALNTAVGAFHVRAPALRDAAESPPEVLVTPIRIVAPDTVIAIRPGMLEIELSGTGVNTAGASGGAWSIRVTSDTSSAPVLLLSVRTRPDSSLSVPTELLPPDMAAGRIDVEGVVRDTLTSVGGLYRFDIERKFGATLLFRIEN
jgi:hypothetical protein